MLQRWRTIDNAVSDLTGLRFEPQTSHSRDERVAAWFSGFVSVFDSIDLYCRVAERQKKHLRPNFIFAKFVMSYL